MKKHWSDCAVYNEPAYPNGICNCTQAEPKDLYDNLSAILDGYLPNTKNQASPIDALVRFIRLIIAETRRQSALGRSEYVY